MMTIPESLGDTLRKAIPVPSDTMITLDLPLLVTQLSQIPAAAGASDAVSSDDPPTDGE